MRRLQAFVYEWAPLAVIAMAFIAYVIAYAK